MATNKVGDNDSKRVVKTDEGAKDGQNKCPKCGATDIAVNAKTGRLRCNFCRHEFEIEKLQGMETDISKLEGEIMGSGAQDIAEDEQNNVITLKCSSCGAEVVIDTNESTQARCHWCRNTLSVNQQVPNGVIPDVVLPFNLTKEEAKQLIEKFVGKRKFFAHPQFSKEFTTNNIMGVYFPYMLVDINSHAHFSGQGEHQIRKYTRGTGDNQQTYYDADLYNVEREFDLTIEGLSIESNAERLNKSSGNNTNNVINAIMPFDTENCAKYNANYLKGYTSEKRNINIDGLRNIVDAQSKDIARYAANETLKQYDRGVKWDIEQLEVKGKQWKTAYLPVWLYSYQQKMGQNSILHYVAVNARTKETMGSVPIHIPKLLGVSALIELLGILLMLVTKAKYGGLFLLGGLIYFLVIFFKYRNMDARHYYESETTKKMDNIKKVDELVKHEKGLSYSNMIGANNKNISGRNPTEQLMNRVEDIKNISRNIDKDIFKF